MNVSTSKSKTEALRSTKKEQIAENADACRRKFLRFFPKGFYDDKYIAWERGYKWQAHERWNAQLNRGEFEGLLKKGEFSEIANRAVKIESPTNLIFSFEKMALRDAVKSTEGAKIFATGLFDFLHGKSALKKRFDNWIQAIAALPKKQSRVLTQPLVTVFGFLAQPEKHIFLKPNVTRTAALKYGFDFQYKSRPSWETYSNLLEFAEVIKNDLKDLKPRDMIDIQSFIWVQGSDEYSE